MTVWNPHDEIIHEFAEKLRNSDWIKAHNVHIVEQNKGSLAEAMKKALGSFGVVAVIGIDTLKNHQTYCDAEVFVSCTEAIPTNRSHQGFVTALDVALAAVQILDNQYWMWGETTHETPHDYVLQATSTFSGSFKRTKTQDPTQSDYKNREE